MNKPFNKKENIIVLICAIVIIISIVLFSIIYTANANSSSIKFNEHLSDNILTITPVSSKNSSGSFTVSLKEISYYILVCEANVNNTAALYNPDNTNSYWNLYISNTFMKTIAKDTCMDMCKRDNIYYLEAVNNNYTLDTEEQKVVLEEASYIYQNLTGKQVDATNLTLEALYNIRYKINLASKYINHLMNEYNYSIESLNIDGEYYNSICENYNINVSKLWDEIVLGDITIDR